MDAEELLELIVTVYVLVGLNGHVAVEVQLPTVQHMKIMLPEPYCRSKI